MKYFNYLLIVVFLGGCAVQGPISGGPKDTTGPKFESVSPENNSEIDIDQKIIIFFDESLDPNSVRQSIMINNDNEFRIVTKKNKITVYPNEKWDENRILNIYLSRELKDYRNNNIEAPLDLSFSFGQEIPDNSISLNICVTRL